MARPRKQLVSLSDTPYYHLVSRCVRRAYLCGTDPVSGECYEHRRQWIENRIRLLSSLFAIDVCAYAVMSNHFHLAVKVCPEQVDDLSDADIVERWTSLFKGPLLVQRWQAGEVLDSAEYQTVSDCINVYRQRLGDLSWFMRCLNEPIARMANKEDDCTGHFWESRFKSQALLSIEALLSCMAYIDLNPLRAKMAPTPEASEFTSIKERIKPRFDLPAAVKEQVSEQSLLRFEVALKPLASFEGNEHHHKYHDNPNGIFFSLKDYLELVDYTGRVIQPNKRGAISETLPPILQRIGIDSKTWLKNSTAFESIYHSKFAKAKRKPAQAQAG